MKLRSTLWLLLVLSLLAPATARRPGPRLRNRIRPTPEELRPLPEGVIVVPPPERSSVDAVPISTLLQPVEGPEDQQQQVAAPEVPEVQTGLPEPGKIPPQTEPITSRAVTVCTSTDISPIRRQ